MNISTQDLDTLVVYALQYALGRRSYATAEMQGLVKQHWTHIGGNTRALLRDRVARHLRLTGAQVPDTTDTEGWLEFLYWLDRNMHVLVQSD